MAETDPKDADSRRSPGEDTRWTIAVSGSTGLIGTALIASLRRDGHWIRRLVRSDTSARSQHVYWDPQSGTLDPQALAGVDAVVHLAGANIGERWTEERKREIRESRVDSTRLLAGAIASLETPPRVMVNAGGVGIYGDRGDEPLDESSTLGDDFLGRLGQEWEAAAEPAVRRGIRVVKMRAGVVVSPNGGMLQRLLLPFRLGVGGKVGSGRQWLSWIALTDMVAVIRFLLFDSALDGAVNVMSPNPVTNAEFTRALGRVLGRPTLFTVPATALRLVYGEMADATILASQRAHPKRLHEAGFRFRYPGIEEALRAELAAEPAR